MNSELKSGKEKKVYKKPEVLVTYNKKELEESIKPYGMPPEATGGGGCGCGCGGG